MATRRDPWRSAQSRPHPPSQPQPTRSQAPLRPNRSTLARHLSGSFTGAPASTPSLSSSAGARESSTSRPRSNRPSARDSRATVRGALLSPSVTQRGLTGRQAPVAASVRSISTASGSGDGQRQQISMTTDSAAVGGIFFARRSTHPSTPSGRRREGLLTIPIRTSGGSSSTSYTPTTGNRRATTSTRTGAKRIADMLRIPSWMEQREERRDASLRSDSALRFDLHSPHRANVNGQGPKATAKQSLLWSRQALQESNIFHHTVAARCKYCPFNRLPTEVLCTILEYVVEPAQEEIAANDDGDGPKANNSLLFWYLDPNRSLLRLVCRSWNQTILAMAREINVKLGPDESMQVFLEAVAVKSRTAALAAASSARSRDSNMMNSSTAAGRAQLPLRRSARLSGASLSSSSGSTTSGSPSPRTGGWEWSLPYSSNTGRPRVSLNLGRYAEFAESHGIQSDRHPRLFQHIVQDQCERRRIVKQKGIPIQSFYNTVPDLQNSVDSNGATSSSRSTGQPATACWTCPPFISSLSVHGDYHACDPKEDMVISPHTAGIHPQSVGNPRTPAFGTTARCANEKAYGAMLDHWLQSAVPKTLSTFSISNSFDFGLNGMICLPSALTTLNITRCPKITGGVLAMGFQHLSNLVSLTMCSDLLFTDESFLIALSTLGCLRRLIYIYPCDPVQPPWRDLFRYCSSCELYHRRVATKTYTRRLLVPELPSQIQELRLEMDEAKYKHVRIDTYEQSQHGFDRTDRTKFSFSLWKAEAVDESDMTASWRGFAASPSSAKGLRSWWPENLTRLNLSKCSITNSRFDVPSNLKELVICYPLEPNEMNVDETIVKLSEDKQWFPDSMMSIEVLGVPYHVSCELQNNPNERALGWIEYTNKMLKMVPRQLERLVVNCLQVPDEDSLNLMQRRVGRTLKTWVVRILCPQRPKVSGFSASHLYSPIIHFDSDEEGLWGYNDDFSSDDSWDSESDDDSIPESPSARSCRRTRELHYRAFNEGRANIRQSWEMAAVEQYDVTPVRLREATRGLAVLSQMEVGLNSQHFRFCRAVWKDALSLVDQSPTKAVMDNEVAGISVVNGASGQMLFRKRQKIERNPFLSSHVDRKGKGRAEDQAGSPSIFMMPPDMKGKGKGKKLDFETDFSPQPFTSSSNRRGDFGSKRTWDDRGQDENRSTQSHSILGHGRQAGLKVEIQYWDNSCCGKQCLGHARNQQD